MKPPAPPRSGEGTIGRWTARLLAAAFLATLALPAAWQAWEVTAPSVLTPFPRDLREGGLRAALRRLETRAERKAAFTEAVRRPYRGAVLRALGHGTGEAGVGGGGYLFHRGDLHFACGPGFLSPRFAAELAAARDTRGDAFEEAVCAAVCRLRGLPPPAPPPASPLTDATTAVRDVARAFRGRGLALLVVPVPGKAAIHPEDYAPGYPAAAGPAENRDLPRWRELLAAEGVPVVDLARPLWEAKARSGEPLFLKADSHWSPRGLAVAADVIAARAREVLGPPTARFPAEVVTTINHGDLPRLLDVRGARDLFPGEPVTLTRVRHGTAADVVGDDAPVLLLGDSFATIFQGEDPACGAGLAAQLMLRLGRGVQTLGGPGTRPAAVLAALSGRPGMLAHKKLVIWTFADRRLGMVDSWESVPLPPP